MGKGQSKGKLWKSLEELQCKDWKAVENDDPAAVEPLCYWIKKYGFNGKLSTTNVKELQQKIKTKTKNKDTLMAKEGFSQTLVWMKLERRGRA